MIVFKCDFCDEEIDLVDLDCGLSPYYDGTLRRPAIRWDLDVRKAKWHACRNCRHDLGVIFGGKDSEKA